MMILSPTSESDIAAAVADAREKKTPLAIEGGGTRKALGRPAQSERTLSLAKMNAIVFYEPGEMVFCAQGGVPVESIEAMLAERGQMLPFEPVDHRRLYGSSGAPTIGAVAACNISGPRRISHGAARDSLIGLRLVNGAGEAIKTGGRVMKNVTGLDLVKLSCGAHGTLGVLAEATFKVLPRPEASATLVIRNLDDERAVQALSQALGSPFEVSGAAHLPAGIGGPDARTLLRVENFKPSVEYRIGELRKIVGGDVILYDEETRALWRDIRDCAFFAAPDPRAIWRVSTAPSRGADLVRLVRKSGEAAHFFDWGGGLVWLAVDAGGDARAKDIRAATAACGGHATLVRAPDELRARMEVFQPLPDAVMTLTRGIKASFDPDGILNPGRMYAGV
ncbi:MAG: glycolate oxidase subunit GlcE [Hyphomicrobiales bacterium]|nr:glycolate oxidase subunit GlcE [Hyphomicrobiales bacterium]